MDVATTEVSPDAGEKPPLLLLNGMAVSSRAWPAPWLQRLERSFRLLVMDNRGTGASPFAGEPFSIADLAHDTAEMLDREGHDQVDVFGHSMGALIALALAVEHPDRVRRLVVAAAQLGGPGTVPGQREVLSRLASLPVDGSYAEERLALQSGPAFSQEGSEMLRTVAAAHAAEQIDRRVIGMQIRAMSMVDPARMAAISAPTLVIHGDADPLVPLENGRRVAEAVPAARLEVLAGIGHLVIYEAMEPCSRLIEAFLEPGPPR